VIISIGIALWQIPYWIAEHPYENWSPLYYGFIVCVAGLIMLIFSKDIRDKKSIFIVQLMGYFGLYPAIRLMYLFLPISLSLYLAIAALFIGMAHFFLCLLLRRMRAAALFSALRIFLFFSAYSMFFYGQIGYASVFALFPKFSKMFIPLVVVSTVAILPEIFGLMILHFAKKKRTWPCIITSAIAAFLLLELFPVRNDFIHSMPWDSPSAVSISGTYGEPIGEQDVEQEFLRSLSIIDRLTISSQADPAVELTTIALNRPKLERYPMMLNREWFSEYITFWSFDYHPEFFARFFTQETIKLNLRRDSDNDGLGDFYEAILLCDANNPDTDNDGIGDSEDSDPRHAYRESIYGHINAAVISSDQSVTNMRVLDSDTFLTDKKQLLFHFINNEFPNGDGEIANFERHVVILDRAYRDLWFIVFGGSFCNSDICYFIEQYMLSTFRLFAVVRVSIGSYAGGTESVLLIANWRDKWYVLAENIITVWIM